MIISKQKLFFGDNDAIFDVIEEPVGKWHHNYRHEISRDPFVKLSVF